MQPRADPLLPGKRHALVIANHEYVTEGLSRLRAPARDAARLAAVLGDPEIGAFDVRVLENQDTARTREAVEDFFADRAHDDLLLLYFSGHGVRDQVGDLHFATVRTRLNRLQATAVSAEFVRTLMNRTVAGTVVLLLDCCYAGAFGNGMTAKAGGEVPLDSQLGGSGRVIITASRAIEYAFEGFDLADRSGDERLSLFTAALVEGLATGDADRGQDGLVDVDELYDYVRERIARRTRDQTPTKWVLDAQGAIHIARRGKPVATPAVLPDSVLRHVTDPVAAIRAAAVDELVDIAGRPHQGLALAARLVLADLVDDDSRRVSAAAARALGRDVPDRDRPAPGVCLVVGVRDGFALDSGQSRRQGEPPMMWPVHGGPHQLWRIEPAGAGEHTITSVATGLALEHQYGGVVLLGPRGKTPDQRWRLIGDDGLGRYRIATPERVLTADGAAGAAPRLDAERGTESQRFMLLTATGAEVDDLTARLAREEDLRRRFDVDVQGMSYPDDDLLPRYLEATYLADASPVLVADLCAHVCESTLAPNASIFTRWRFARTARVLAELVPEVFARVVRQVLASREPDFTDDDLMLLASGLCYVRGTWDALAENTRRRLFQHLATTSTDRLLRRYELYSPMPLEPVSDVLLDRIPDFEAERGAHQLFLAHIGSGPDPRLVPYFLNRLGSAQDLPRVIAALSGLHALGVLLGEEHVRHLVAAIPPAIRGRDDVRKLLWDLGISGDAWAERG
ncbi:caspase, EACC1-associated type [Saccharothrix obliqua]|uniref:caspase, EACC1-associated type n=1 Tax=Saccharothrix obliqua TaxID=2861747 RepID=UPI001C5FA469|nr:caspase family protein [Saccharothrix obliqua]MBW4718587.1 caspase family protein [Saccharothrix obliqua]